MLGKQILLFGNKKMVLPRVKNNFACRTQFLLPDHTFRSLRDMSRIEHSVRFKFLMITFRVSPTGKKSPKDTHNSDIYDVV